jgi:hypothetical protein
VIILKTENIIEVLNKMIDEVKGIKTQTRYNIIIKGIK